MMQAYGTLLLLIVAWGALSFGAVYPWAYWPLAAACAALGLLGLRASHARMRDLPAVARWLGVFALGVLLQLLPLPRAMLIQVSPSTDAFLQQFRLGYALSPPAWHPLSIVPAQTWTGLGLFVALALFLLGASRALSRLDLEALVRRVILFAVALGVFAIVQEALLGDVKGVRIYGFWAPQQGGSPFGPFVNHNHFAGWMLMATPLALGHALGLFERLRPRRGGVGRWLRWIAAPETGPLALVGLAILATGTSLVLTTSRSGIGGFAVAVLTVAAFVAKAAGRRSTRVLAITCAALLVAGIIGWAGSGAKLERFSRVLSDLEIGRFAAWRDTAHIIRDFPIFGTGFNTYGSAMLVYQTSDRTIFYREAHNDYLQVVAEGGLLLAVPALLAVLLFARDVTRRFREGQDDPMTYWIRVGAVAGLAGIAAQSTMDFSLQMPGNAALCVLLGAIAMHRPGRWRRGVESAAVR